MPKDQTLDDAYVVFDMETTGFSPIKDKIIEIGAVKVEKGKITEQLQYLCKSKGSRFRLRSHSLPVSRMRWSWMHRIFESILPEFLEFVGDACAGGAQCRPLMWDLSSRTADIRTSTPDFDICGYGGDGESPAADTYQNLS